MPLIPMPPMPTKCTRRFGPFTAVTPWSALSGHPVHPTCPATMRWTYRSSVRSSSRPAFEDLGADPGDVRRGLRPAERAGADGHLVARGGVVEEGAEHGGEPRPVELAIEDQAGRAGRGEDLAVAALVVVGGKRVRHQDGRQAD